MKKLFSSRPCRRHAFAWLILLRVCLPAAPASAQTADEIETLLATGAVTYGRAARFVLEAADVTVTADPGQAFQYAAGQNWLPKKASANDAARLDGIALLVMRSFDVKGGMFYSVTKNPHYAYRELAYKKVIFGWIDPAAAVSGDDLLYIVNRIIARQEKQ